MIEFVSMVSCIIEVQLNLCGGREMRFHRGELIDFDFYAPGEFEAVKRPGKVIGYVYGKVRIDAGDKILDCYPGHVYGRDKPAILEVIMSESHKFQVRIPVKMLAKIREWADQMGMSVSEFMLLAVNEGGPVLLEKYRVNEKKVEIQKQ